MGLKSGECAGQKIGKIAFSASIARTAFDAWDDELSC